jgi:protein-disulfide isomerase
MQCSVDTSELTRRERQAWVESVNDLLSPCGDPVSVARCAQSGGECAACLPAARYVARLVTEGYDKGEIEERYDLRYGRDAAVTIPVGDAPVRGSPMAPVTIVEFSDFECPYCGEAHPLLKHILREHEGQVRLVFMHYPLDAHPHAAPAARAAIAAGNQGRFWEMHDLLFDNQSALENEDLIGYASELGLDMVRFEEDFRAASTQAKVEASRELGQELGVQGTPTIFVNGRRFSEPPRALPAYLREEIGR